MKKLLLLLFVASVAQASQISSSGARIGGPVTGGTQGSVLFVDPTGVLDQDNANFFWDDTNNRLGLGTTTPTSPLTLLINSSSPALHSIEVTNTNSAGKATFYTVNDAGTGVGFGAFGTTFPVVGLANEGAIVSSRSVIIMSDTNVPNSGTNYVSILTGGYEPTTQERMRVTSAGDVGIGTTTPGQKLTVEGTIGILETGASPSFHTIFQGGDQAANITYTLPTAQGAIGTSLINDGAGGLSWLAVTPSIGGTVTSGTAGSVLFIDPANTLAQDNANFFWDNANNRLGIGTTTPGQKLTIDGTLGILEGGGSPTFHTIFQGGDQAGNITYTLPTAQGGASSVLTNDGAGILSWAAAAASPAIGGPITGGTAGSVLFIDPANTLAQDNANFFFNNTNNRLGLGTITPNQQLELTGNIRLPVTTATTGIYYSGGSTFLHGFGPNNTFLGAGAGNLTLSTATQNTGLGALSLTNLTTASDNAGIGIGSLSSVTTGSNNVAIGSNSGNQIDTGSNNTSIGHNSGPDSAALTNTGAFGSNATVTTSNTQVFGDTAVATYLLGEDRDSSGAATARTLHAGNANGTNQAGGNLTVQGSRGTGSGVGGDIIFQTAPAGTSGTTLGTLATRVAILNTGLVGIGTAAPVSQLDIRSTAATTAIIGTSSTTDASTLILRSGNGTTSGESNLVSFISDETTPASWSLGMNASKDFSLFDNITSLTPILVSATTDGVAIRGTSTNDNAPSGYVGTYHTGSVTSASATAYDASSATGTFTVKAISTSSALAAGDYDVWGSFGVNMTAGAALGHQILGAINSGTGCSTPAIPTAQESGFALLTTAASGLDIGGGGMIVTVPSVRVSISASTTYCVIGRIVVDSNNNQIRYFGSIHARRRR